MKSDQTVSVHLTAPERWLALSGVSTLPVKGKDQAEVRRELMLALLGDWRWAQRESDNLTLGQLELEETTPITVTAGQLRPMIELLDLLLEDGRVTVRQAGYLLDARAKFQDARR